MRPLLQDPNYDGADRMHRAAGPVKHVGAFMTVTQLETRPDR
jgi:hypothetical protein